MRCVDCPSERAYAKAPRGLRFLVYLLLWPVVAHMRCEHCFREFWYPRILTIGRGAYRSRGERSAHEAPTSASQSR